ncbi:la-related protein 4-like isoform X2 [Acanthaster planci]|uniref:La-related protein 4-like isoform X2 n=1 Tax=Acanthaster planci TaxID=133434 RepID=A0A8B7ZEL0_ACAPL|nr:la-related protein 4-like isoform X2 [Acanthaster planci]
MPTMLTFPPQGIWTVILAPENGSDNETAPKVKFSLLPMTTDRSNDGDDLTPSTVTAIPKKTTLNPNAKVFQSPKLANSVTSSADSTDSSPDWHDNENRSSQASSPQTAMTTQGPYQVNGDVGKFSGLGYPPSPESPVYSIQNGYISGPEYPYLPDGQLVTSDDLLQQELPKGEDLRKLLQRQLEYYFSRENLANDRYLQSQMDADQYVPISTIANFNAVKKLTKDMPLIVEVLRESPCVKVDDKGEMVRPNHKRCTVILREVSEATPLEEVKALFTGENCPKFVSCEFAHNSNWYITFESDADAQKAYRYIREEVGVFQGKPIMARIKAKPLQRINFSPKPSPVNGYTSTGQQMFTQQFQYPPSHLNNISQQPPQQQQQSSQQQQQQQSQSQQQQQYPFYSAGVGQSQQQWGVTSSSYFETPPMNKFQAVNVNRQHAYQGPHSRPHHKSHSRTSSTPELRTTDRVNNSLFQENSIHRSHSERRTTPNGPQVVSPRGVFDSLRGGDVAPERRDDRDRRDDKERDRDREMTYSRRRDIPPASTLPVSSSSTSRNRYQDESPNSSANSLPPNSRGSRVGTSYRDRRPRRREDELQNRRNSRDIRDSRDKEQLAQTAKELPKAPSPQIDLASFPPLPGRTMIESEGSDKKEEETNNNDLVTPMADIVKGVKDPKRAAKSQEPCKPNHPATKDSATNTSSTGDSKEQPPSTAAAKTPTSLPSKQTQVPVATQTDLDLSPSPEAKSGPVTSQHHAKVSQTTSTAVNTTVTAPVSPAAVVARTTPTTGSTQTVSTGSQTTDCQTLPSISASCSASTTTQATDSAVPRLSYAAVTGKKAAKTTAASTSTATVSQASTSSTTATCSTPTTHSTESSMQPRQSQLPQASTSLQTHPQANTYTGPPNKPYIRPRYGMRGNDREQNFDPSFKYRRDYYTGRRSPPQPRYMNTK